MTVSPPSPRLRGDEGDDDEEEGAGSCRNGTNPDVAGGTQKENGLGT